MDQYTLMRIAEDMDDDAPEPEDYAYSERQSADSFTKKYKEFYDDIKISPKEDW